MTQIRLRALAEGNRGDSAIDLRAGPETRVSELVKGGPLVPARTSRSQSALLQPDCGSSSSAPPSRHHDPRSQGPSVRRETARAQSGLAKTIIRWLSGLRGWRSDRLGRGDPLSKPHSCILAS